MLEPLPRKPLTQRVEVGAFYTDGGRLGEVVAVNPLGYVTMTDAATGEEIGKGIDAFRRTWWLVKLAPTALGENEEGVTDGR